MDCLPPAIPRLDSCFCRLSVSGESVPRRRQESWGRPADGTLGRVISQSNGFPRRRGHCIERFLKIECKRGRRKRVVRSACKRHWCLGSCALPSVPVVKAVGFFTTDRGVRRRETTVNCTGTWLAESTSLCVTRLASFYKHRFFRQHICSGSYETQRGHAFDDPCRETRYGRDPAVAPW